MPYIYLGNRSGQYVETITGSIKATYDITTAVLGGCKNIHKVIYDIKFDSGYDNVRSGYYTFYIYSGSQKSSGRWESTIHCNSHYNRFVKVQAYYSPLDMSAPFLMSFFTTGTAYYQLFNKLKTTIYYYSLILTGFDQVDNLAKREYRSIYLKHLFHFEIGDKSNARIRQMPRDGEQPKTIGNNKFKTITYMVESGYGRGPFLFYSSKLFALNPKVSGIKNEIDASVLESIDSTYNILLVYYVHSSENGNRTSGTHRGQLDNTLVTSENVPENTAIFFELIKNCDTRIQFKRANISNKWEKFKDPFYYNNESELVDKLDEIKAGLYESVTYEIDLKLANNSNYNNCSVNVLVEDKTDYVIYTHTPTTNYKDKKSEIIYNSAKFEVESSNSSITDGPFENIQVYYRTRKEKEDKTDPLLLVECTEKSSSVERKKTYYVRKSKDNDKWSVVTLQTLTEMKIVGGGQTNHDISEILRKPDVLQKLLRLIEVNLFDHIGLLINKTDSYNKQEVETEFRGNNTMITLSNKQPETIDPIKTSLDDRYVYYKHTIKHGNESNNSDLFVIIPFISGTKIDTFSVKKNPTMLFYGGNGGKGMSSKSPDSNNRNEFYVFFYQDDNTPLLFCYCNTLYGPISKREYHKWIEVESVSGLSDRKIVEQVGFIINKLDYVDLSATDKTDNLFNKLSSISRRFQVQVKSHDYSDCNLFGYYRHNNRDQSKMKLYQFIITTNNGGRTINVILDGEQRFSHIDVYYSLTSKQLLVAAISQGDTVNYYQYNDFITQTSNNFYLKIIKQIAIDSKDGSTLTDHLIYQGDSLNDTVTYRLERTTARNMYETSYNKSTIILSNITDASDKGYNVYTHKPNQPKKSCVLYNNKLVEIEKPQSISTGSLDSIADHCFSQIVAYSLTSNNSLLLLIELKENTQTYYFYRVDTDASKWKQLTKGMGPLSYEINKIVDDNNKIKLFLRYLMYTITKSVIIYLRDKSYNYKIKLIDNSSQDMHHLEEIKSSKIPNNDNRLNQKYRFRTHALFNVSKFDTSKTVTGIRLFNGKNEVKLYDETPMKNSEYLFYESKKGSVYVYFDQQNNDPIGVCYDGKAYGPKNKEDKNSEWFRIKNINNCYKFEQVEPELDKITQIIKKEETSNSRAHDGYNNRRTDSNGHSAVTKPGQSLQQKGSNDEQTPQETGVFTIAKAAGGTAGGVAAVAGLVGGGFFALKHFGIIGVSAVAAAI